MRNIAGRAFSRNFFAKEAEGHEKNKFFQRQKRVFQIKIVELRLPIGFARGGMANKSNADGSNGGEILREG